MPVRTGKPVRCGLTCDDLTASATQTARRDAVAAEMLPMTFYPMLAGFTTVHITWSPDGSQRRPHLPWLHA